MIRGKFIVFEGIDGSGKSTQSTLLYEKLLQKNIKVRKTFEPTKRPIGELIRTYLRGECKCDAKVLAGLFASDRLDHYLNDEDGIIKTLSEGTSIICDRNYLSNFAYQADEDEFFVPSLNQKVRELQKPDIHIFIDVEPKIALSRITKTRKNIDIFENEDDLIQASFNYKKIFDKYKDEENIVIIDGNQLENEVLEEILNKISYLFDA